MHLCFHYENVFSYQEFIYRDISHKFYLQTDLYELRLSPKRRFLFCFICITITVPSFLVVSDNNIPKTLTVSMAASKNRLTFSKQKHIEFWVRIVYFGNPGRIQRVPLKIKILFEQKMWTFSKRLWKDLSVSQEKQNLKSTNIDTKHWKLNFS